jgi:osmotically-inducible protein OsmY
VSKTKDLREAVEKELGFDPLVDSANIVVKDMNGEVALNGTVANYPQYLEAAAAARRVSGVTKVHNHLEVVLPPADQRDDLTLTNTADTTLAQNVIVPDGVKATVKNGNLTLTGTVSYGSQRTAAESAVAGLTGVRHLKDDIEVENEADPVDATALVQDALHRHALVADDSDVAVDAEEKALTLTGHVRTLAEHDAVISAAWMANGVAEVCDNLKITG